MVTDDHAADRHAGHAQPVRGGFETHLDPSRGNPGEPVQSPPVFADDTPTQPVHRPLNGTNRNQPTGPDPRPNPPLSGPEPETAPVEPVSAEPVPGRRSGSLLDDAPEHPPEPIPAEAASAQPARSWLLRMTDRLRKQLPYGLVLLTMVIGVVRIVEYHWREGSAWIGGAVLVAGLLRAVLPPRKAGMVAVRGRVVDVFWCLGLALCILFVAYTLKA